MRSVVVSVAPRWRALVVSVGLLAGALLPAGAHAAGKVSLYLLRMEPRGRTTDQFSRTSWGCGASAVLPLRGTYNLLAFTGGIEVVNFLSQTAEFRDRLTGFRFEQQTNQYYGRVFAGGRYGVHGAGFLRPFLGAGLAVIFYGIDTDVVVPDDYDREKEIRQSLRSEWNAAFGYDLNAGFDLNFANKVPVEVGVRFLKSYNVPQQLGDGAVSVSPEYVQVYLGVGLSLEAMRGR